MTSTLLQLAQYVAIDVGLAVPSAVAAATDSTDRTMVEMKQVINFTGKDLARRVDWAALRAYSTITGTGVASAFSLPASYERMIQGNAVNIAGTTVRGGLAAEEFLALTATAGTPRFYLIAGSPGARTIQFWPTLGNGVVATINYQSGYWNTNGPSSSFSTDSDTAVFSDQVFIKGSIARWRRQKGMDYQDYQDEFEQSLKDHAMTDDNARTP